MTGPFDPSTYPGPRPSGPVLVHRGAVTDLEVTGEPARPVRALPGARPTWRSHRPRIEPVPGSEAAAVLRSPHRVHWCVAYGSNASPERLIGKGLDRDGAVLLPAELAGWAPAFEHRRTAYGAVPLTLVPSPGTVTSTWLLGLPDTALPALDRSEGRRDDHRRARPVRRGSSDGRIAPDGAYQLATVGEVVVAGRYVLADAPAYVPGPRTRIQIAADGRWRMWPRHGHDDAVRHLERDGRHAAAPRVASVHRGGWPRTHFTS